MIRKILRTTVAGELQLQIPIQIHKPEGKLRAPKIACMYCSMQGLSWCKICFAPLCAAHLYPRLTDAPHTRVFLYDGDEVFCREHEHLKAPEPRGYVEQTPRG